MKINSKKEIDAIEFFNSESLEYGENFDIALCIEDIHRIYGKDIADSIWELATIKLTKKTFDVSPLGKFVKNL